HTHVTDTGYPFQRGEDVYVQIVLNESSVVVLVVGIHRKKHQRARLLLLRHDARLRYFAWQERQCAGDTVLNVDRSDVGVDTLFKKDLYRSAAVIACG